MDCLELAPHYDPSGVSAITMAKTLREMILLACSRNR
jgi:arginase family enzyme